MAEYLNGSWIDYLWLGGRLIGREVNGGLEAIHDDQTGRPQVVTNTSGAVVWNAQNGPFSRTVTLSNAAALNVGFPGQYYDQETGLWNNGFRDYDPTLGRYVESDPIGLDGGVNSYAYVSSNPLSLVDPLGLRPGDAFSSAKAAANDALRFSWLPTTVNSVEYAGLIYRVGSSYYATTPVPGGYDYSTTFNSTARNEVREALGKPVGEYHTHPYIHMEGGTWMAGNRLTSSFNTNCYSPDDIALANKAAGIYKPFTSFLGTPDSMQSYTPSTGDFTSAPYNW
jgi:RHS repeat-associated protein